MTNSTLEVLLPDFGDGDDAAAEAAASYWPVEVGASLREGDDLLEVITDKASFVVPCPCAGVLLEKCVREDERVRVGQPIAVLQVEQ